REPSRRSPGSARRPPTVYVRGVFFFFCHLRQYCRLRVHLVAFGIANPHPDIVMWWSLLIGGAMLLWVQNCYADPGWLTPRTIFPQDHLIGDDPNDAFDAWQPVESQMAHCESLSQDVPGLGPGERSDGSLDLARLELEQNN
ncbi:unnamed protein product, partial [Prorocentrum cordatum]